MATRRQVLTHGATAAGALVLGSAGTLAVTRWAGQGEIPPTAAAGPLLDDASRLNPTAVRGVLFARPSADDTARMVAPLLRRIAAGDDPAMAVAGVRHSMGGQSMHAGGWVLDARPMNQITLDRAARVVRVGAGTTWRELIPVLNAAGLSPKVMQSNHDFSIGGSISVNCHGWHAAHPPIASTVRRLPPNPAPPARSSPCPGPPPEELQRAVFRNSAGSRLGKMLHWQLEREAAPWLAGPLSRNSIQNEPAAVFADHSAQTCDILHEYFVPRQRPWDFVQDARSIIEPSGLELLNVTVRDVRQDTRSTLAYAREDVFGLVMNFRQDRTDRADRRMRDLTRALIDAAARVGGTFYLPYRLHATGEQLRRAYPGWDAAMAAKARVDPRSVFRNALFDTYAG